MWLSQEDARSDFILAASALVFGTIVVQFLRSLAFYPGGLFTLVATPVWVLVLMVLSPRFLAQYREQGIDAHGLVGDRGGLGDGILLVAPLLAAGFVRGFIDGDVLGGLLGRVDGVTALGQGLAELFPLSLLIDIIELVLSGIGMIYLFGLLTVRARDGFRAVEMPLLEALRTYGLGAVGIGTVLGLLLSLGSARATWAVVVDGLAMVAVILLTDRMVANGDRTNRATILAPAIVAVVAYVFAVGGGLFSEDLAVSLYRGAMAASVAIVLSVLLETRRAAWLAVPLVAATVWLPTCATLPVAPFIALGC